MALTSTTNRNDYTGDGATSVYAYTYRIFANTDLLVTVRNTSNAETTLTLTTDYTVSGVGDAAGGNVTLVSAGQAWLTGGNLTTDYILTIRRVRPLTQTNDIRNQGDFLPETHENEFDHLTMLIQQLQNSITGAVRLIETVAPSSVDTRLPVPAANQAVRWNSGATALENFLPGSAGAITLPASNGLAVYTGSSTFIARTLTAGDGSVTITNGDGQSGNPTVIVATGGVSNTKLAASAINSQTSQGSPSGSDEILIYDTGAMALRKTTLTAAVALATTSDYYERESGFVQPLSSSVTVAGINTGGACSAAGTNTAVQDSTGSYINYASTASLGNESGWSQGATSGICQLQHNPKSYFVMKTGSNATDVTGIRIYIIMDDGNSGSPMSSDTPTNGYIGFRYSTAVDGTAFWRTVSDNQSGTPEVTVTTVAIATNTRYELGIDASNPASIVFSINGSTVATHTSKLPSTSADLGFYMKLRNLDATSRNIRCSKAYWRYS